MSRKSLILIAVAALALVPAAGLLAQKAAPTPSSDRAWLHVRVEEPEATRVVVNLPLAVVEAVLEAAPERIVSDGRVRIPHTDRDLHVADLRRLWREIKATGDAELVSIRERDESVTVARRGDVVQVRVTEDGERESVVVDVPVALVDVLLSGEGEELDLRAGLRELARLRGDIVRVEDGDTKVRVWVDESN